MSLSLSVLLSVIENGGCEVFSTCKLERRTPEWTFGAACLKCTAGGRRFAKNMRMFSMADVRRKSSHAGERSFLRVGEFEVGGLAFIDCFYMHMRQYIFHREFLVSAFCVQGLGKQNLVYIFHH